jgi:hypothetical protein
MLEKRTHDAGEVESYIVENMPAPNSSAKVELNPCDTHDASTAWNSDSRKIGEGSALCDLNWQILSRVPTVSSRVMIRHTSVSSLNLNVTEPSAYRIPIVPGILPASIPFCARGRLRPHPKLLCLQTLRRREPDTSNAVLRFE